MEFSYWFRKPRNGHGRLKYAKNLLSKELGDIIFGVDPTLKNELTVDVHLNDILPSIEYDKKEIIGNHGRSKAYEDKDIPLKVIIFPLSSKCGEASESVKDLIILIKLAKSGSLQGIDGKIWKTLSKVREFCCEFYCFGNSTSQNVNIHL